MPESMASPRAALLDVKSRQTLGLAPMMRSTLARLTAAAVLLVGSAAVAQDANPLLGEWEGIMRDAANVAMAFKVSYFPDGSFTQSIAVPPKPDGTGSGFVITSGQYRISGKVVQFRVLESKICAAGAYCSPYPPGLGESQVPFSMNGPNEVVSNGTVAHRTQ
jgi:hypothetical protein